MADPGHATRGGGHGRRAHHRDDVAAVRCGVCGAAHGGSSVSGAEAVGLLIAAGLLVYLVYVLAFPEKF